MICSACQTELDESGTFPGGKVVCACGAENVVPGAPVPRSAHAEGGPYRTLDPVVVAPARMIQCPFCGAPCPPDSRRCAHCDVELASVRCPHCFALHFTGSRFCARCGKELELEPLLDATDGPCPRCDMPLSVLQGAPAGTDLDMLPMHECVGCGGLFVSQKVLDAILARKAPAPHAPIHGPSLHRAPVTHPMEVVRYLKCPLCHAVMNRVNFGKRSGVIVDVCKEHGVWFDRGELTQTIEFVANGGLADPAASGEVTPGPKSEALRHEAAKLQVALVEETMREARDEGYAVGRLQAMQNHRATWLDILFELLR